MIVIKSMKSSQTLLQKESNLKEPPADPPGM